VNAAKMKKMTPISGVTDPSIDIDGLIPGQLYYIQATFYYNSNNESETKFVDVYTATSKFYSIHKVTNLSARTRTIVPISYGYTGILLTKLPDLKTFHKYFNVFPNYDFINFNVLTYIRT
jgi:hypothetical protein